MPAHHRWGRGQAAAEFAFVGLPLLLLVFATIGLGMAIYSYSFVCTAARDAARYAIVHGASSLAPATQADLTTLVQSEAQGIQANQLSVAASWTPDNNPGSVVEVTVTYDFKPLGFLGGVTLPLTSSAEMVISH
jgi:Flp pilus assembly protein TadG